MRTNQPTPIASAGGSTEATPTKRLTTTTSRTWSAPRRKPHPTMNTLTIGLDRTRMELKVYSREKEAVFFSFLFPILLLTLFSVIFSGQFADGPSTMTAAWFFLPGMIAAGVLLTSFQTMALSVATERDDGTLKRLRATPMPPAAYFLGKVGLVGVTSLAQLILLLAVARFLFDVPMPDTAGRWALFAAVFGLGVFSGTVLGIAYSSLSSSRAIGAVVIGPMLVLQFISGVYIGWDSVPDWLRQIAALFPLKWIAQGMRAVFLPDSMASLEMAGTWEPTRTLLVLLAWGVAGLVLCLTTFRWFKRGTV
ncbi:MAG: ABC transporter permease [Actinomycetales bacterium]